VGNLEGHSLSERWCSYSKCRVSEAFYLDHHDRSDPGKDLKFTLQSRPQTSKNARAIRVSSVTMFRPTFWVVDAWQTRLTSSHGTERSLAHKLPTSTPDELALDPLQHDGSAAQASEPHH